MYSPNPLDDANEEFEVEVHSFYIQIIMLKYFQYDEEQAETAELNDQVNEALDKWLERYDEVCDEVEAERQQEADDQAANE